MGNKSSRPVLIWLITGAIMVAAMVVIGGITRLTESGLSMVEWKLIMGTVPPLSEAEWQATFEKYQQFPEYQKINQHYNLEDFKSIFWWEYSHRLLGRLIGIVFIVPFLFFLIKGYFTRAWAWRLIILFALGGLQGFLGWFMVKSGLVDNPDVSHYRLAIHLIAAFLLFCYIIWLIMDILYPQKSIIELKGYRQVLRLTFLLALVQIIYGAFVAGLNAGKYYPTFPMMEGKWMPEIINEHYLAYGMISLVNDVTAVQFIHRWTGTILFFWIIAVYYTFNAAWLPRSRKLYQLLMVIVSLQVTLGILALLMSVPIWLAILHQFTALLLLGTLTMNLHTARVSRLVPA